MGSIVPFPTRRNPADGRPRRVILGDAAEVIILPVVQMVRTSPALAAPLVASAVPRETL
ncbi:hypothetical protein AncyloWKF20_00580 [Ancylobacter sp. WKF20]|jgi:hypothetical protein|uniref:hypothetical protein n=1 Tax=Ancylobacter sp. WKF20 TaxID=3039801 RepID=UPI00243431EA|nr:hypothetical protein [Ancylobacter sp. WKF20]WGD30371.1 hypothetical protein AncyloWKF20_00580 [Ancylobacter sp. WKF20]